MTLALLNKLTRISSRDELTAAEVVEIEAKLAKNPNFIHARKLARLGIGSACPSMGASAGNVEDLRAEYKRLQSTKGQAAATAFYNANPVLQESRWGQLR